MENQYIERGIYKVRQDGTKDFVAFKTRAEKLAEKLADGKKKRALVLQKLNTFISDIDNLDVDYQIAAKPKSLWFQLRDGKDLWHPDPEDYRGWTKSDTRWIFPVPFPSAGG